MEREGDMVTFDPVDKSRYANLPDWAPIEAVAGIFGTLTEKQQEARDEFNDVIALDIMDISEHMRQHKMMAAHRRLHDLGVLKAQLGRMFPEEIAASIPLEEILPDIDLTVLHQK